MAIKRLELDTDQKALEINLDENIYGTFAEIGAGQEVARYFFKVGAAAGTIAKSMSAYDKKVSDDIYGVEPSGRYVCQPRLYKMLDHEYALNMKRLRDDRPEARLFAFADTVAAINYSRTIKGNGWLGIRFQSKPDKEPNEIVLHVRMKDRNNPLQQQAIGVLGVNLVYGAYNYYRDPETMIVSLMDNLHGRISIDLVKLKGPEFESVDGRLPALWLVKNNMTEVAIFDCHGQGIHASEFLYKKEVMIVRGNYRPTTNVHLDLMESGFKQFCEEEAVDESKAKLLAEITLENLGKANAKIDEKDFLDRAEILCAMGKTVVITNCDKFNKLISYLSDYKVKHLGVVFGIRQLIELINQLYYQNKDDALLYAFGQIFHRNVFVYAYPAEQRNPVDGKKTTDELVTTQNMTIPKDVRFLVKHLVESRQIVDMKYYKPEVLYIYASKVLSMIRSGEEGWEKLVPAEAAQIIKQKNLFDYKSQQLRFEV